MFELTKYSEFLKDFLDRKGNKFKTIHLDKLNCGYHVGIQGKELLDLCQKILNLKFDLPENCTKLIFLPLGFSTKIKFWQNSFWELIGKEEEPPCLCFIEGELFENFDEEYRVPIKSPLLKNIKCLFRCFRGEEGTSHEWEFCHGIYLIKDNEK